MNVRPIAAVALLSLATLVPIAWADHAEESGEDFVYTVSLTQPRWDTAAVHVRGEALIFGGINATGAVLPTITKFSSLMPSIGSYANPLPQAVHSISAVWDLKDRAYIFGGDTGAGLTDDIVEFFPETATPGGTSNTLAVSLPTARAGTSAVWADGRAYVIGGTDGTSQLDDILLFDPVAGTVTEVASLPVPASRTSAVWTGSEVLVFGGWDGANNLRQIVRYDPSSGDVTLLPNGLSAPTSATAAVWTGEKALIIGGKYNVDASRDVYEFDPLLDDHATFVRHLDGNREGASAIWTRDHAEVFGGRNSAGVPSTWIMSYKPLRRIDTTPIDQAASSLGVSLGGNVRTSQASFAPDEPVDIEVQFRNAGTTDVVIPDSTEVSISIFAVSRNATSVDLASLTQELAAPVLAGVNATAEPGRLQADPTGVATQTTGDPEGEATGRATAAATVNPRVPLDFVWGLFHESWFPGGAYLIPPGASCVLADYKSGFSWFQTSDHVRMPPGRYVLQAELSDALGTVILVDTLQFELGSHLASTVPPFEDQGCDDVASPSTSGASAAATGGAWGYNNTQRRQRWPMAALPQQWHYNWRGEPVVTGNGFANAVERAFNTWNNDGASNFQMTQGPARPDTNVFDLEGDTWSMVGWQQIEDTAQKDTLAQALCGVGSNSNLIDNCWMTFDLDQAGGWDAAFPGGHATRRDVETVALHEAGHWLHLGHTEASADNSQNSVMFRSLDPSEEVRALNWGDRSGIRYLYPNKYEGGSISDETAGGDVAVAQLDADAGSRPDAIFGYVTEAPGSNRIQYKVGWNIDANGRAPTWTGPKAAINAPAVGDLTSGLGMAFGQFDNDGRPDLVTMWVDAVPNGDNEIYYKVGWNLNGNGDPTTWSGGAGIPWGGTLNPTQSFGPGHETQGIDVCVTNLNSNSRPDLVVMWMDNPSGENNLRYAVGFDVGTDGWTTNWRFHQVPKTIWVGGSTSDVGLACYDITENGRTDLIVGWTDMPDGENKMYEMIGSNPDSTGAISTWERRELPGRYNNGFVGSYTQGFGMDSVEIDGSQINGVPVGKDELVVAWLDAPSGPNFIRYMEEWNGLYFRHP